MSDLTLKAINYYNKGYEQGQKDAVVHAHWVKDKYGNICCSKCLNFALESKTGCFINRHYEQKFSKFCPSCGAKMDEELPK